MRVTCTSWDGTPVAVFMEQMKVGIWEHGKGRLLAEGPEEMCYCPSMTASAHYYTSRRHVLVDIIFQVRLTTPTGEPWGAAPEGCSKGGSSTFCEISFARGYDF